MTHNYHTHSMHSGLLITNIGQCEWGIHKAQTKIKYNPDRKADIIDTETQQIQASRKKGCSRNVFNIKASASSNANPAQ